MVNIILTKATEIICRLNITTKNASLALSLRLTLAYNDFKRNFYSFSTFFFSRNNNIFVEECERGKEKWGSFSLFSIPCVSRLCSYYSVGYCCNAILHTLALFSIVDCFAFSIVYRMSRYCRLFIFGNDNCTLWW